MTSRYLHTMVRITDFDRSRAFYEALGMEFRRDLDIVRPRAVAELPRIARHAPDRVSSAQQLRDEPAADVPRRAGNQAVQWR